ncbi:transposase [Mycobacterium colombiense]|uniref:transposase n=1 Tax=Mycobacterium colombiense TaxID=339268 RepID=UPI003AF8C78C
MPADRTGCQHVGDRLAEPFVIVADREDVYRTNQRNGYRNRQFDTRTGTLDLVHHVPGLDRETFADAQIVGHREAKWPQSVPTH